MPLNLAFLSVLAPRMKRIASHGSRNGSRAVEIGGSGSLRRDLVDLLEPPGLDFGGAWALLALISTVSGMKHRGHALDRHLEVLQYSRGELRGFKTISKCTPGSQKSL